MLIRHKSFLTRTGKVSAGGCSMSDTRRFLGAVEAGGTKFVVAIGTERGEILAEARFPTTDPVSTLALTCEFLRERAREFGALTAIGVASFGPVELDRASEHYGFIGQTPKAGWSHTDMAGTLAREFPCPIGFDTD